ncbi:MAG: hypothetical protein ACM33T_09440 [Solirubrobacterales bacterium]
MAVVALPSPLQLTANPGGVETVRTLLKRDVAAILHANLPALALVPVDKVYDRVLDDPALLHQALRLLRRQPELFKTVLATRERALPSADADPLSCGRTLAEIIALVVRACARRYFRHRLPGPRRAPAPRPGFFLSLAIAMGWAKPKRLGPKPVPPGERLFRAMRDLLQFDWQVPLIPAYSTLTPETVTELGPRLLDCKDSATVAMLADRSVSGQLAEGKTPLLMDSAKRLMAEDGASINAEILWTVGQKMHVSLLFPEWDPTEMRRALSVISATSQPALEALAPALGGDIRAFTLFLFTAYNRMGINRFKQVFGPEGQLRVVKAIAARMAHESPKAPSLEMMKAKMEALLDLPA